MNGSDGTSLVNSPIDTPVTSGSTTDRPLIGWIFEDEEALEQYHETYSYFVSEYIESGWLEEEIARVSEMIRPYVEADENSFYSAEEFDEAVETLQAYCSLRGESIRGQLEGTIPSTSNGQRSASASLVNASDLNVSTMGSMGSGGGFGGGGNRSSFGGFGGGEESSFASGGFSAAGFSGGERPSDTSSGRSFSGRGSSERTSSERTTTERPASQGSSEMTSQRTMPSSADFSKEFSMPQGMRGTASNKKSWIQVGIYALILLAAIGLVLLVRRRNE
jgi:hypothetical protein